MQQEISVSLGDVFRFILRGLFLALVLAAIGVGVAYYLSSSQTPVYSSQATLLINLGDYAVGDYNPPVPPPVGADVYATAAESGDVLGSALVALGLQPDPARIGSLANNLTVIARESSAFRDTPQLDFTYVAPNAESAATTVNAIARALIDWDRQRAEALLSESVEQLDRQIANTQSQLEENPESATLQAQLEGQQRTRDQLLAQVGTAQSRLSIIRVATPSLVPSSPKPFLNAVIAGVLGFLLGYGILLIRNLLDTRLRSVEDLESVSALPILAEFPKPSKKTRRLPREASGYLRTNLLLATQNVHPKVILVTSPRNGEGKSSVALSLAESFTRANYRTLLVDADLRRPVIAREYNLDDKRHMPLRTHLENPQGSYEAAHVGVNLAQTLDIIPTFRAAPSPTELLSLGFPGALASWEKDYDVIVVDSAPLLDVADTLNIAPLCTGTVMVASLEETAPQELSDAVDLLQRSGVRIFGIAATFVGKSSRSSSYRYSRDSVELFEERDAGTQGKPAPRTPATAVSVKSTDR